tara:strand:- start:1177 stop:3039 length:1863 start_codon:yes stop_codon:yes gene_type:complete
MAGEYGVNINLRVKGQSGLDRLKQKVNQLTASVDKIRAIDIMNPRNVGGKGGKQARKELKKYTKDMEDIVKAVNSMNGAFGKTANQQMAAAEALQEYANSLEIGTDKHKAAVAATEKQVRATNKETFAIKKNNEMRKKNTDLASKISSIFGRGKKGARGGGGDGALSSALVSGAFPLLFGQGPLGGAFGFAGGFLGTKMGGQMGGFAGGLVATAALQQITTAVQGLNELGRALEPFTLNIDKINQSLGLVNTPTGEYLKLLEETEGTQAAFNAAMVEMEKVVGKDGVKALKDFGEGTKQLQSVFSRFLTQVAAFAAKALNFATASFTETDPSKITGFRRASLLSDAKQNTDARLISLFEKLGGRMTDKDRKEIQNKIIAIQLEKEQNDLLKLQKLRYDQITKSVEKKNEFLLEATQVGQREAGIQEKLREFDEQAKKAKGGILDITSKQHQEERKIYEDALRLQEELQRISNLYQGIASTIKTGVVDAIDGAIKGTMTLGEVARSVFGSIQRQLIDFGATSILRSLPVIGGFFANGGVTKPNKSYIVGERGPELFTPGVTGRVTPNHEMGGGSTNVVVNVDASGSSVEGDEQRGRELGRLISVAVQSELLEQKRPGGLLA